MQIYHELFIGGGWAKLAGTGTIEVINPSSEEPLGALDEYLEYPSIILPAG